VKRWGPVRVGCFGKRASAREWGCARKCGAGGKGGSGPWGKEAWKVRVTGTAKKTRQRKTMAHSHSKTRHTRMPGDSHSQGKRSVVSRHSPKRSVGPRPKKPSKPLTRAAVCNGGITSAIYITVITHCCQMDREEGTRDEGREVRAGGGGQRAWFFFLRSVTRLRFSRTVWSRSTSSLLCVSSSLRRARRSASRRLSCRRFSSSS